MMQSNVKALLINYKTLEEFQYFKGNGIQELCMYEDLRSNLTDNDSESPFYGIYFGGKLVARMSLYESDEPFYPNHKKHLELFKLEVLPEYQSKGLGTLLVHFAKSFNLPIKAVSRAQSDSFWLKQQFTKTEDTFYLWFPESPSSTNCTELLNTSSSINA